MICRLIVIVLISISIPSFSQNLELDSIQTFRIIEGELKEPIYIVKIDKQYFYLDSITPYVTGKQEVKRVKRKPVDSKKFSIGSDERGILIVVKRKYWGLVENRIKEKQTSPNTR